MPLHDQVATFLASAAGRGLVKGCLSSYHLPRDLADDLTQEAMIRALRAEDRGVVADNPEAFTTVLVRRAARDLLRGRLRRPEVHLADLAPHSSDDVGSSGGFDPVDDAAEPAQHLVDAEDLAALGERVDATRTHLATRLARRTHPAAVALAVLAIVHGDAVPAVDVPVPKGGVAATEGVWWAGVFYGGPDGCFGSADDSETTAVRKRRSRALASAKAAMRDAVTEVTGD